MLSIYQLQYALSSHKRAINREAETRSPNSAPSCAPTFRKTTGQTRGIRGGEKQGRGSGPVRYLRGWIGLLLANARPPFGC